MASAIFALAVGLHLLRRLNNALREMISRFLHAPVGLIANAKQILPSFRRRPNLQDQRAFIVDFPSVEAAQHAATVVMRFAVPLGVRRCPLMCVQGVGQGGPPSEAQKGQTK